MDIAKIEKYVNNLFPHFGVNKIRETVRLLYEISKRENTDFKKIIGNLDNNKFDSIKTQLLKKRYPDSFDQENRKNFYLPKLEINPKNKTSIQKPFVGIQFIEPDMYVEESVQNADLVSRFRRFFPKSTFKTISSLKEFLKAGLINQALTIQDYNKRGKSFFIVKERYDFFKACPCTPKAAHCGYKILNIGFGCLYECSYCFLQEYQNFPGIIFPANIDDFFREFTPFLGKSGIFKYPRIGSGEFTDSLLFDEITGFSSQIINFFKKYPNLYFEFKTKSTNIQNILNSQPSKNIVISWSLNPQNIIDQNEFYSSSLKERISAAKKCVECGFSVGFHFDPIIYYNGWEKGYSQLIEYLFSKIPASSILWISLGTLRMNPSLKKVIENRFPDNKILDAELIIGFDGKLRYPNSVRLQIYKKMTRQIRKHSPKTTTYICMDEF